ncbi:MAG TPA: proton-conducting transporter membrane subunit [Clostridia bacterium]|nr:proton-conducting transporter membrane subunit [Clostridia bacterium]
MPLLFIIFPLITVLILNLSYKKIGSKAALLIGTIITLLQMLMSMTFGGFIWKGLTDTLRINFITDFRINSYSLIVLFTIGLISFVSLIVGRSSTGKDKFNFVNLVLIILMGMNGVTMVADLFSLYVFLEITGVASFVLISLHKDKDALQGSFKYLLMSAIATVFMLTSIAIIFMFAGSLSFDVVNTYILSYNGVPFQMVIAFMLFITGLSIKAGLVPFHGWLPDAYSSAPAPVSILLAGIVTKVTGVYTILILFTSVFGKNAMIGTVLMVLGIISILVGALAAMSQDDFKKILAYSSISQVGYIILAVGIGSPLALLGAILHFFNHASFKSLLFVNSAAVEMQTGTRKISSLGGLASRMPITGGTSIVGFLSAAGIPPLSGFWSKLIIIIAAWQAAAYSYAAVALLASILTIAYFLRLQRNVFFGHVAEGLENVTEANVGIKCVSILLAAINIVVGILFPLVFKYMQSIGWI